MCKRLWIILFPKNMGKNLSNKYCGKLLDSAKKSTTDAIKTASKRAIQKTIEATDLIGNKIPNRQILVPRTSGGRPPRTSPKNPI